MELLGFQLLLNERNRHKKTPKYDFGVFYHSYYSTRLFYKLKVFFNEILIKLLQKTTEMFLLRFYFAVVLTIQS